MQSYCVHIDQLLCFLNSLVIFRWSWYSHLCQDTLLTFGLACAFAFWVFFSWLLFIGCSDKKKDIKMVDSCKCQMMCMICLWFLCETENGLQCIVGMGWKIWRKTKICVRFAPSSWCIRQEPSGWSTSGLYQGFKALASGQNVQGLSSKGAFWSGYDYRWNIPCMNTPYQCSCRKHINMIIR